MTVSSLIESICYFCTLLFISFVDYKSRRIPNWSLAVLLGFRLVFLICYFLMDAEAVMPLLLSSVGTLFLTSLVTALFLPAFRDKTGAGDFKLLLVCSFCFEIDLYLNSLLVAIFILTVCFILQLMKKQQQNVPLAPFVCCTMLIASVVSFII